MQRLMRWKGRQTKKIEVYLKIRPHRGGILRQKKAAGMCGPGFSTFESLSKGEKKHICLSKGRLK